MRSSKLVLSAVLALALFGCAARQLIAQGNQLLAQGKHNEAIQKYQEALKIEPGSTEAQERIKEAQRAAVRVQLDEAEGALSSAQFAVALKAALKARRMPLDLEDVDLVRRIDDTIAKAARLAEERVDAHVEQGFFVPAVELAEQVRDASPGIASREKWVADVKKRATEHYLKLATDTEAQLPGSSAVQLAMARSAGATVDAAKVASLWSRFAEPTCFAAPEVAIQDASGKAAEFQATLEAAARTALDELRARCGEGTQPLGVTVTITALDVVDKTEKERGVTPLPGVDIATEEIYYDEEKYKVMEEVIEEEERKEPKEFRDCAPRPGKERGCRTWTEEVSVKVPVKKVKEVEKIRRIEKRRPIAGDLPADKVVFYDVNRVTRRVAVRGKVEVLGALGEPRAFALVQESVDEGHDEVKHAKLTLPADPLDVLALPQLVADASAAVSREVGAAVEAAVEDWSKRYEEEAGKQVLAGRLPEAEELYLKLLALGVSSSKSVGGYFEKRYGRSVAQVMSALGLALGRAPAAQGDETVVSAGASGFPKVTAQAREAAPVESQEPAPTQTASPAVPMVPKRQAVNPTMSDDELKSLEEESLQTAAPERTPTPEGGAPAAGAPPAQGTAPEAGATPPPAEQKPAESGSEEAKPRAPIKPKT